MKIEELYQLYLQYPSVKTDTRKLEKNDMYFALKGPNFNGNEFAAKAFESGAAKAIIDDARFEVKDKTILVEDVLSQERDNEGDDPSFPQHHIDRDYTF